MLYLLIVCLFLIADEDVIYIAIPQFVNSNNGHFGSSIKPNLLFLSYIALVSVRSEI